MAQQVVRGRTTLPSTDPYVDNIDFDFTFEATGSGTSIDFDALLNPNTVIQDFLNTAAGSHNPMCTYIPAIITRATNACYTTWTDVTAYLDGSPAGSPIRTDNFTLGPAVSGPCLPPDACLVLSYHAAYGSTPEHGPVEELPTPDDAQDYGAPPTHMGTTRPRARLRSRLFFGPLNANNSLDADNGTVAAGIVLSANDNLNALLAIKNHLDANQFNAVVWSRRDAAVRQATHYYVSPGFGTVRRRGDVVTDRVHGWLPITEPS